MSKDIWHKPTEPTDPDNQLIIDDWIEHTNELGWFDDEDKVFRKYTNDEIYTEESLMRWCDVDDIVNDYERLQNELERTRKALEIAVDALRELKETVSNTEQELDMTIQAANALEQITALEQKE